MQNANHTPMPCRYRRKSENLCLAHSIRDDCGHPVTAIAHHIHYQGGSRWVPEIYDGIPLNLEWETQMKKLVLGIVGLTALLAAPAMAADLAARPMPVKAVAPPVFSWTGCYVGVHVGGGKQSSDYVSDGTFGGVGAVGGAQAGCNLQWRQFVIGVEGEYWASGLRDRDFFQDVNDTFEASSRNRWDAAISLRSGFAFERAFIYGKLGVVWGKFDYALDETFLGSTFTERGNATFTGVLIGAGFEYALTDNWTTKFEYNYIDFGNKVVDFTQTSCSPGCVTTTSRETVKEVKQIAKVGVNYKF
jgi:outer membrane immunogenic protein